MPKSLNKLQTLELIRKAEAVKKRLAEISLIEYAKQAWKILEPKTSFIDNWHIHLIGEYLEAVNLNQIKRLIINIPPRQTKSSLATIMFPTWEWIKNPEYRYMCVSYSDSLSTKHSLDRRTIIQSEWYQRNWGDIVQLSSDQNIKTEFANNKRGHMTATSIGGTATGKGGNRIIIDDPVNPKMAFSDAERNNANRAYDLTLSTRLDDETTGAIILIMQRLHENDLTGHILSKETGWEHLKIPAEADKKIIYYYPLSKEKKEFNQEDLTILPRLNKEKLESKKKALGSYGYSGQFLQDPSPLEGGIFKRSWWKFYTERPKRFDEVIQSWDLSFKDMDESSYVVGQVWGRIKADKYLIDQIREKMDFTKSLTAIRNLSAKYPEAKAKLVEDKANGPAVISVLKKEIPGLIAILPQGSKVARASAVSPEVESGNIYLPSPSITLWIDDFIEELSKFPNAKNDDQVDSFSMAILRLSSKKTYDVSLIMNTKLSRISPNIG